MLKETIMNMTNLKIAPISLILLSICINIPAIAVDSDIYNAPPSYHEGKKTFVPVDIVHQEISWAVAGDLSSVQGRSRTTFSIQEPGSPFLLLNPSATCTLVSENTSEPVALEKLEAPQFSKSNFYFIDKVLVPGTYVVEFQYSFVPDLKKSYFLPIQYNEHAFGEVGIPSNYSYDHFKLTLDITINNQISDKYRLITNGSVTQGDKPNSFHAEYPSHFTSMSFFVDIVDAENVIEKRFQETSVDGRKIDILVYSTWSEVAVEAYQSRVKWDFSKVEKVFGPYPFQQFILKTFGAESSTNLAGAFSGAILMPIDYTDAFFHELGHSWYMQNLSPAQGDDMWIYEGIGTWAPSYLRATSEQRDPKFHQYIDLSANPYFLSSTARMHDVGAAILAEIDGQFQCKGGLLEYLREIHAFKMRDGGIHNRTLSTKEFKSLLEQFSGENLDEVFRYYFKNY